MNDRDRLIGALTLIIDPDRPPGLAARRLACTVVQLVEDRQLPETIEIDTRLMRLLKAFPRRRKPHVEVES